MTQRNTIHIFFFQSLKFRLLAIITLFVMIIVSSLLFYSIKQFHSVEIFNLEHEGLLLSDTVKSGILNKAVRSDIDAIQEYIDQLVRTRNKNDIEINVIFLESDGSTVVASNVIDNIEATEPEEHLELMKAITGRKAFIKIEREDDVLSAEDWETHSDPLHPDYFLPPGQRFINISTPLIDGKHEIGAITIKLSIRLLDEKLELIYRNISIAFLVSLFLLVFGMVFYLSSRLFQPLWRITEHLYAFGLGSLKTNLPVGKKQDEIMVLSKEFNDMADRIKLAEEKNIQYQYHLEELVEERTKEILLTQGVTIEAMGILAETRDPETGGHIKRTQNYVKALSKLLQNHPDYSEYFNDENVELLYKSAPLHDIGKVGIPDAILLKPGKLTADEFEEMKKHTTFGYNAILLAEKKLGSNSFLRIAREIAYTHQEKWDGSGYPQGLKGNEIPISGRLMALADVYDALISKRVYKEPFPHAKAVRIIVEGKGSHFDPIMVDAFVELQEKFREIAMQDADYEEERIALFHDTEHS